MDFIEVPLTVDEILGRAGGRSKPKRPTVFVAYRMNIDSSKKFREDIESLLTRHEGRPMHPDVVDGRVEDGAYWAPEIRNRISRARLVVADVTGPSRDVVFEVGLAAGKPLLPVVESDQHRSNLPKWLTAKQMSSFEGTGTVRIADNIWTKLNTRRLKGQQLPQPDPTTLVWLQTPDSEWCNPWYDRFQCLCQQCGLQASRVFPDDLNSPEGMNEVLRSWLVVGCMDGGAQDSAVHYVAGDVVSRRDCIRPGRGPRLSRSVLMLCQTNASVEAFVADSVKRVPTDHVKPVLTESFLDLCRSHFNRHRKWMNTVPRREEN